MSSVAPGLIDSQMFCYEFDLEAHKRSVRVKLQQKVYEDVAKNISFDPSLFFIPLQEPFLVVENQKHPWVENRTANAVPFGVEFTEQLLAELRYFNLETAWVAAFGKPLPGETLNSFLDLNLFYVGYSVQEPMGFFESSGIHYISGLKDRADPLKCRYIGPWGSPPKPKPSRTAKTRTQPDRPPGTKPKHSKPDRRKKRKAPKDVQEYFSWVAPKSKLWITYKALYSQAWYGKITKNKHYQGKKPHMGRYYTLGNKHLENVTGLSERTIINHIKLMLEHKIVQRRKKGRPGLGNSIIELPLDVRHTKAWKREYKTWIKPNKK